MYGIYVYQKKKPNKNLINYLHVFQEKNPTKIEIIFNSYNIYIYILDVYNLIYLYSIVIP
jgi:hypothetical protein